MSEGAGEVTRSAPGPGSVFGPYTIVESLGAGGMGEVFRARDARLNRQVALKFLPEELSTDEQLLNRFQREAKLLALVNHPNIATIHSIEDDYQRTFLVLELVEGESLASILKRGPLTLREALRVCRDIAAALEAAHRKGIVHRDLKPANVMVTLDGIVKVLDFGIAKPVAYGQAATDLEQTPSQELTATGTIIGTGPYMSPEQVRGKTAGRRADIWAFGCLMYQALTGKAAFERDTLADTLTSILQRDPDWSLLPAKTPESIRRLLQRCLQKDPAQRLQAIGDARIEIVDAIREPSGGAGANAGSAIPLWQLIGGAAAMLLSGFLIGALVLWSWISGEPSAPREVYDLALPPSVVLGLGGSPSFAVSRDGTRYVAVLQDGTSRTLHKRDLSGSGSWEVIAGTEGAEGPFFSWTGDDVGFFASGGLYRVPYDRPGPPILVADAPEPFGGAWGVDDTIYFSSSQSLWSVRLDTLEPEQAAQFDVDKGELGVRWPSVLPDGETVMYVGWTGFDATGSTRSNLYKLHAGEEPVLLYTGAGYARYSPSGHLVALGGDRLVAIPFARNSLSVTGAPLPVNESVLVRTDVGVPFFAVAAEAGTFVNAPGNVLTAGPVLVRMSAAGPDVPEPVQLDRYYENLLYPRLSEGGELAVAIEEAEDSDNPEGRSYVIVSSLGAGGNSEELASGIRALGPEWGVDGSLTFADGAQSTIRSKAPHTNGPGEVLLPADTEALVPYPPVPTGWSSTGVLFYNHGSFTAETEMLLDVWYIDTSSAAPTPRPLLYSDNKEYGAVPSPDGRLVAYVRRPPGEERSEIVVISFPDATETRVISSGSDCQEPMWATGDRLFYRCGNEMWVTEIQADPIRPRNAHVLWSWPFALDDSFTKANYAYDPRRELLWMVSDEPIIDELSFRVVRNWNPLTDVGRR